MGKRFVQIAMQIVTLRSGLFLENQMPLVKPKPNEIRDSFIDRCMADSTMNDEYSGDTQRLAVCQSIWESEKAMTKTDIIKSLSRRTGRYGVLTADRYFRSIEQCFDGEFCPVKLFNSASQDEWAKSLKESEGKLTYSNGEMLVKGGSVKSDVAFGDDQLTVVGWRKNLTAKPLVIFDAIVTTTTRDRDRDVMETKGAELDPASPLLWQHIPLQPIGALVGELKDQRTDDMLPARFAIADTELGRDAATLVEMGALRISHGFDPKDFEPMDDADGWHFKEFEIFEVSLVSVPSNTDAVITAFSREKLHSPLIRGWAEKMFEERPVQGVGYSTRMKHGELEYEFTAPTKDELKDLMGMQDNSHSRQKDAHGDEEKLQCPECGFKGTSDDFVPKAESEDDKSAESEKVKLSYEAMEETLMFLANDESPLRLEHTRKRLEAAIQNKEYDAANRFLVEAGVM